MADFEFGTHGLYVARAHAMVIVVPYTSIIDITPIKDDGLTKHFSVHYMGLQGNAELRISDNVDTIRESLVQAHIGAMRAFAGLE